jgi:tetratricopeptide (TPR) repeat protein
MRRLLVLCVLICTGCGQVLERDLRQISSQAQDSFDHGDLATADQLSNRGYLRSLLSGDPEWQWRFRSLQAEIFIARRNPARALALLSGALPEEFSKSGTAVRVELDRGTANLWLHKFDVADWHFDAAERLCSLGDNSQWLGDLRMRQGFAALFQREYPKAEKLLRESISLAHHTHRPFLEANAATLVGVVLMRDKRYSQAIDWIVAHPAKLAQQFSITTLVEKNLGNLGECYYNIGDQETALANLQAADKEAAKLGLIDDRRNFLNDIGLIYADRDDFASATRFYLQALGFARQTGQANTIAICLHNLAMAAFNNHDLIDAKKYNEEEMRIKRQNKDRASELYGRYLEGRIRESQSHHQEALAIFAEVTNETGNDFSLRWQAQASAALVHEAMQEPDKAKQDFDSFLQTVNTARDEMGHDEFKIHLRSGLNRYYSYYIQFLMRQGKPEEALKIAETSRALVLTERLGLKKQESFNLSRAQAVAGVFKATILSYWLTPEGSYLWVVTPTTFAAFTLPPGPKISELAESYRGSVASSAKFSDTRLFETLIAPAQSYLTSGTRVIVIPDGNLHQINFETLLVPGQPQPHYWIEDVVVSTATSMALLSPHPRTSGVSNILLMGNPNSPGPEFPTLPNAALELHSIADRFPVARKALYEQENALPSRYLAANPGAYSWIHFAAHGVASMESPLDSAIILSNESDSYKLYARDIAKLPLKADLVTISACYGSGTKTYAGEGIVGLAWAFQLAGAHNVIAALWEANDYYTAQLMDRLYEGLMSGQDTAYALRSAKLSLLHSEYVGRNPRHWGPFQLYTGY